MTQITNTLLLLKVLSVVLFFQLFIGKIHAQTSPNLIRDGGFEDQTNAWASSYYYQNKLKYWFNPRGHLGRGAYFSKNLVNTNYAGQNSNGTQEPQEGSSYFGVCLYHDSISTLNYDNRSYIVGCLSKKLTAGACYKFSYYYSLADYSSYFCNDLHFTFLADTNTIYPSHKKALKLPVHISAQNFISNKTEWVYEEVTYIAQGWERFIMIGNQFINIESTVAIDYPLVNSTAKRGPYGLVYLDNITLKEIIPSANFLSDNKTICDLDPITIKANPNLTPDYYLWSTGDTTQNIEVNTYGTYSVEIGYGGCKSFDAVLIDTIDCSHSYATSNVFTPNGDGVNDVFKPSELHNILNFTMVIYNRWGQEVFNSVYPNMFWDGNLTDGRPAPAGVYNFIITYTEPRKDFYIDKGFLHLIR